MRCIAMAALAVLLFAHALSAQAMEGEGPIVRAVSPPFSAAYASSRSVGPAATISLSGCVNDDPEVPPALYRYLLKMALVTDGETSYYVSTETEYALHTHDLVDFFDPAWTEWTDWPETGEPEILLAGLDLTDGEGRVVHYILALQAKDELGLTSDGRVYGLDVHNFSISSDWAPTLSLREPDLGIGETTWTHQQYHGDVAPHQPIRFTWLGTASSYGEDIVSYRWGWDIQDLEHFDDPGWGVPPGLGPDHVAAPEIALTEGAHVFTVQCVDSHGAMTRVQVFISVVPIPAQDDKLPLLLMDDVQDQVSAGWPDQGGYVAHDNDVLRDARWLGLLGNVVWFDPETDVLDNETELGNWGFRDVVNYKVVIWATSCNPQSYIAGNFQPRYVADPEVPGGVIAQPPAVWLESFQRYAGNLLLVGSGATGNFNPSGYAGQSWLMPIVYEASEPDVHCEGMSIITDFGDYIEPGGSVVPLGTVLHPYRSLGVSVMDVVRPFVWYGHDDFFDVCMSGEENRRQRCVGTKAVTLDPVFRSAHGIGSRIPEEIATWDAIDFMDHQGGIPPLDQPYIFGAYDEFYDMNITQRPTAWAPQQRPDGGPMIEPMWRLKTRYDWILEEHLATGEDYPEFDPVDICGLGVFPADVGYGSPARTLLDGAPTGILSYATVATKPSGIPDVVWGFDPTRFDPIDMRKAIEWVLGDHFGLNVMVANEPVPPIPEPEVLRTWLRPCRPNPFNPRTTIAFDLHRPGSVELGVYDAKGRHVATLVSEARGVGRHTQVWNGLSDDGRAVPSGVYFARLITETSRESRRMLLLR